MEIIQVSSQYIKLNKQEFGDYDFKETLEKILKENNLETVKKLENIMLNGKIYSGDKSKVIIISNNTETPISLENYRVNHEQHIVIALGKNENKVIQEIEEYCNNKNQEEEIGFSFINIKLRQANSQVFQTSSFIVERYSSE